MKQTIVLLVVCVVVAYQFHSTTAQFSFSMPNWGTGKRGGGQGWAKRAPMSCDELDTSAIYHIYKTIQVSPAVIYHVYELIHVNISFIYFNYNKI